MTEAPDQPVLAEAPVRRRSVALDVIRIAAILGVVAIHVFGYLVTNEAMRGTADWWVAQAVNMGSRWVVPVIIMVSGALLLGPRTATDPAGFYRRRLVRLGPAFVFWPLFYIFVVRMLLQDRDLSGFEVVHLFITGKSFTAMYFLWLIAGLYVIAPVLASFLNGGSVRRAYLFAGVTIGATLAVYAIAGLLTSRGFPVPLVLNGFTQFIPYVGYFLLGWAFREAFLSKRMTLLAALATVLLIVETVAQSAFSAQLTTLQAINPTNYLGTAVAASALGIFLVGLSALRSVDASSRFGRVITELSAASFGVFLIHLFFVTVLRTLVPTTVELLDTNVLATAGIWLGVVVVSFAVSMVLRRIPIVRSVF